MQCMLGATVLSRLLLLVQASSPGHVAASRVPTRRFGRTEIDMPVRYRFKNSLEP